MVSRILNTGDVRTELAIEESHDVIALTDRMALRPYNDSDAIIDDSMFMVRLCRPDYCDQSHTAARA